MWSPGQQPPAESVAPRPATDADAPTQGESDPAGTSTADPADPVDDEYEPL
jgi:hypothetical protein